MGDKSGWAEQRFSPTKRIRMGNRSIKIWSDLKRAHEGEGWDWRFIGNYQLEGFSIWYIRIIVR